MRAERAHRRVLVGIVPSRHCDDARHAGALRRERDRLAVIAGAGADNAPRALVIGKRRDQVDAAANLERAGRVVIFVFDVDVEPGFGGEERMPHQRRAAYQTIDPCACAIHIVERGRNHAQYYRWVRAASSRISLGMRTTPSAPVYGCGSRTQRAPEFRLLLGWSREERREPAFVHDSLRVHERL